MLSKTANLVLQAFENTGLDKNYISDKAEFFRDKHDFQVLLWCSSRLDDRNSRQLSNLLGVDITWLEATYKVIDEIETKGVWTE